MIRLSAVVLLILLAMRCALAGDILYIHGDVAADGSVPSGDAEPYDQMLLNDDGPTGISSFRDAVRAARHTIEQRYDQQTTLNAALLNRYDLLIFGLHQKIWSSVEKNALDQWLKAGGSMLIYSDSASGGFFQLVGSDNSVGQAVTNNLIAQYGMQVTVDQADGVPNETARMSASISGIVGQTLRGEGVSPIAIREGDSRIEILIDYSRRVRRTQNLTIDAPMYASLALRSLGRGHVAVLFDRQPMWNGGPGADINSADNRQILISLINFLAARSNVAPAPRPRPSGNGVYVPIIDLLLNE